MKYLNKDGLSYLIQKIKIWLNGKVDKVDGMGLSSNDFTDDYIFRIQTTEENIPTKTSQLTNDSGYLTSIPDEYVTETKLNSAISGKANTSDLNNYYTKTETNNTFATVSSLTSISTNIASKQDKLVSGSNIKTINGNSLLGEGNITIEGSSGGSSTVYSTEEQVVGTWVDGSTVYRKVIHYGTMPNKTSKTVAHNISRHEGRQDRQGRSHRRQGLRARHGEGVQGRGRA